MQIITNTQRPVTLVARSVAALIAAAAMLLNAATTMAAETPSGAYICFGDGFAFSTEAPPEWSLDQESGRQDGLCVVGYPRSSVKTTDQEAGAGVPGNPVSAAWKESSAVLFATVTPRFHEGRLLSYEEIQAATANRFRESKPGLEIRDGDTIQVDGKSVTVRKYFPNPAPSQDSTGLSWDTFAYVEEPQHFVTLVLSARSRESHDKAYQAFRNYVRTYKYLSKLSRH